MSSQSNGTCTAAPAAPHTPATSYPAAAAPEAPEQHQQQQTLPPNPQTSTPSNDPQHDDPHPPQTPLISTIAHLHEQVHRFLSESHPADSLLAAVQKQTRVTLNVFAAALDTFPLHNLSLSYNGGKDCLVMLVLFLAKNDDDDDDAHNHAPTTQSPLPLSQSQSQSSSQSQIQQQHKPLTAIPAIYALPPDPFPEVEDFVRWSARHYHLDIVEYTTDPPRTTIRSVFADYLAQHPDVRAIFVGTRRTDPHGARLTHQDYTDSGWPQFLRYHPVIDWHYTEIWAFIRHLGLHYCSLYDQGYTSLGGTADTRPNPKLRVSGGRAEPAVESDGTAAMADQPLKYRPAYELTEDLEERLGRN
ncbi:FAD synthase [Aspergillus saccharolyticus JOP 1030-1]|uniref:FAD synthase n=1 Tax=Aspergillus saccharolyticus JOP 1030-1 TaxID=1450539 RepID=A0A319ATH7_9EURO|nr:adenine nucleotide alpha hydrolases-like protein [Aspergillus saccharolyticus JOP 1030-1]PYH49512.1 adenine nucleotide alpha hydrolases-like protein [Aspergillus saccharolyticus JOP 1030-1]